MRNPFILICLFVLATCFACKDQKQDLVNSVIGNASFVAAFGVEPDENTDNDLRIKTHLEYVAHALRGKDISHLSAELRTKRLQLLDLLNSYTDAGKFPKNYDYSDERKPCFIDRDGNICAVGFLVEQTVGRAAAERINSDYKYETIFNMDNKLVNEWIASSGLTKEECAMIQPAYQYYPGGPEASNRIKPFYALSSAVLVGANVGFNLVNVTDIAKGSSSKTAPVLGLLAGASQVAMGAFGFARERNLTVYDNHPTMTGQGRLSLFNIGIGTTTMLLSGWNLVKQKKMAEKKTSWNIFSFPAGNNQQGIGLSFSQKF